MRKYVGAFSALLLLLVFASQARASHLKVDEVASFCRQTIMSGQENIIEKKYLENRDALFSQPAQVLQANSH